LGLDTSSTGELDEYEYGKKNGEDGSVGSGDDGSVTASNEEGNRQ
jgi:hypothetical protein